MDDSGRAGAARATSRAAHRIARWLAERNESSWDRNGSDYQAEDSASAGRRGCRSAERAGADRGPSPPYPRIEQPVEKRSELSIVQLGHHLNNDIQCRKFLLLLAKIIPNHPLDPVAVMGLGNPALSDDETQPGALHSISNGRQS